MTDVEFIHDLSMLLQRAGVRVPETILLHQGNVAAAEPVVEQWCRALLEHDNDLADRVSVTMVGGEIMGRTSASSSTA